MQGNLRSYYMCPNTNQYVPGSMGSPPGKFLYSIGFLIASHRGFFSQTNGQMRCSEVDRNYTYVSLYKD